MPQQRLRPLRPPPHPGPGPVPANAPIATDLPGQPHAPAPAGLTLLFASAVGIVVLSLYASQTLISAIGPSLGLRAGTSGLVTTLTLLGYAAGLFFLVPLTDMVENRALISGTLAVDVLALAAVAVTTNAPLFLLACFVSGVAASAIQMLVPVAAALSPEAQRGRVVGNVMSGLMLGILLSRPIASLTAEMVGWRWFYGGLSVVVAALAAVLARRIPTRGQAGAGALAYPRLILSMWTLLWQEPIVRRRAMSQALCMAAFSMFWTAVALRLSQAPFGLGNTGIALFALTSAGGAIVAPIAGRAGDRGWTRRTTLLAHATVIAALALAAVAAEGQWRWPAASLVALGLAGLLLDMGVIADQTLGRRAVNLLRPEARGRLNGLFTGLFFLGAAGGAALSGFAWVHGGWLAVCIGGAAFAALAGALTATSR